MKMNISMELKLLIYRTDLFTLQFDVTNKAMSSGGIEGGEIEWARSYIRAGVRLFF